MRSIVGLSLKLRFIVLGAAVALAALGFVKLGDTPTNLLPEFSPTTVEIQTEALGLSAAEVEQLITVPLEADLLNGVAWLESIRSESMPSLSTIELRFEPGTDFMAARHMVQEKMTQAHALPHVSKPPVMLQPVSSTSRVLHIGLSSKELSLIQLSVLAHWNIRPRLMGVPGVANVSIYGQRNRQLQVLVDPERIRANGVSLQNIIATAGNALWVSPLSFLDASSPGTGGFIDAPNQRLGVRHVLPIVSPQGLADVVVEGSNKRLGDVVDVVEDHQPLIGDAIVGGDAGLMLVVEKSPWADTLHVTRAVEKALNDLRPGLKGTTIDTQIFRPANFIEQAMGNVKLALIAGGVLVLIGLLLLFLDLRIILISCAAIVGSLLLAWLVLFLRGAAMNALLFTGLAIAIGVIVDDAIVDAHHIRRRLAQRREQGATAWGLVAETFSRQRGALGFATLMLLLSALPLLFFDGVIGAFTSATALSYGVAVIASFVVALTLTPVLSLLLLHTQPRESREAALGRALTGAIQRLASVFSRAKIAVFAIAGIALIAAVAAYPVLRAKPLLPEFQERDLLIRWTAKPGTSQPEMSRVSAQAVRELRALPGVRNVGGHVGRAITSDNTVGVNAGELWVSIDPKANYGSTLRAINAVVDSYPGMDHDTTTYSEARIEEVSGVEDDKVVVRVYGQDSEVLAQEGRKLKQLFSGIDGVTEIELPGTPTEPTIQIRVDLARAKQSGIKPGDVRRAAATLLSGLEVGSLFEDKKVFDVVVWGTPQTRASISDVRKLLLQSPDGTYVRLAEVADVEIAPHPITIKREAVARYVDVEIDVLGRSLNDVAKDVAHMLEKRAFPSEYHAVVLGDFAKREATRRNAVIAALAALAGVFLLLQAAFRGWRLALAVLCTVPVAALGAILQVFLSGAEFALPAMCGLIAVVGLALRLATLLVVHYQRLQRVEGLAFGPELVARGTAERAVPVVATLLATALALLPFLLYRGAAGLEIVGPMAGVILAGLATTALFALLVLPTVYLAIRAGAAEEDLEDSKQAMPLEQPAHSLAPAEPA